MMSAVMRACVLGKGTGGVHIRWDNATAPELECIEKRRRRRARHPDGGVRGDEGRRRDDRDESKSHATARCNTTCNSALNLG